ncbi:MAG: AMP-binding protein, partial [Opitutales bacterium]
MERLAPFELDELCRDWVDSIPGQDFLALVQSKIDGLKEAAGFEETVVIREEEPVEFAAMFFAALWSGRPLALANPQWGEVEQGEFNDLLSRTLAKPGSILIPTGGTTGGVKLAIHDWSSLRASALGIQDFLGGGPIHSSCLLPLFHVSGLMQLVRSFVTGGSIRFDDEDLYDRCVSLVPTQLQRALKDEESIRKMNTARVIFVGGARISDALADRVRGYALPVVPVYGMTETAAMVAAVPKEDFIHSPGAGAVALGDAAFSIGDDGRIRIRSSALFQGYHGRPPLDLSEGFVVNDEGRLDDAGRLHVIGRVDRLINTGGEKVDPREVEAALLGVEGVEEALVVGEPDDEWGQAVVAFYTGDALLDPVACRALLGQMLAPHKLPKKLLRVDALPAKLA